MKQLSALSLLFALMACAAQPASVPADASRLRDQVMQEIGDARCTQHSECRTIGLGHKACGGPEVYAAWSTARSDANRLQDLVQRYNTRRQADVEQSGRMSNCAVTPDPGAQCVANRCTLVERAGSRVVY